MSFYKFLFPLVFVTVVLPTLYQSQTEAAAIVPTQKPTSVPALEKTEKTENLEDLPGAQPPFVNLLFGTSGVRITAYGSGSDIFFVLTPPIIFLLTILLLITATMLFIFVKMTTVVPKTPQRRSQFFIVGRRVNPPVTCKEDLEKISTPTIIPEKKSQS